MAKQKNSNNEKVVQPLIQVEGEVNLLESIFEGPEAEMPELTSIGFARLSTGTHGWVSYVVKTKGKKVISIEVSEPDLKPIAEESSKINFVNCFIDSELIV